MTDSSNHILDLARHGSVRFALSEFVHQGFDKVRHDEDTMALHGRLYKDLFLSQSGRHAIESARESAIKYETAFKETKGFYSGINAATMSLLAGFDEEMVKMRAERIIDLLPPTDTLDYETKYFVEATRAEAQLLLGEVSNARQSMQQAVDHDPLNFSAHASTIKQFRMIAAHRGEAYDWVSDFQPPNTFCYAGHIFGISGEADPKNQCLSSKQIKALKVEISELLQTHDIGFAYGALAAGSDILIAESILEEGGELHVTLPINIEAFCEASVKPFGTPWVRRFKSCLKQASSIKIISETAKQRSESLEEQSSLANMGEAIRRAQYYGVGAVQLLIWDEKPRKSNTAADVVLWGETGRPRLVIKYEGPRSNRKTNTAPRQGHVEFVLKSADGKFELKFDDLLSALNKAVEHRKDTDFEMKQVLDVSITDETYLGDCFLKHSLPGSIVLSERVANYIAVYHFDDFSADYIGDLAGGEKIYALRQKGDLAI